MAAGDFHRQTATKHVSKRGLCLKLDSVFLTLTLNPLQKSFERALWDQSLQMITMCFSCQDKGAVIHLFLSKVFKLNATRVAQ